jgi:hypothetical protein
MKIIRSGNLISLKKGESATKVPLANGLVTEGTYLGAKPNAYNPEKNDYSVREEDGTLTILNGTASLARQFAVVNEGELVQVTYAGRKAITRKNGTKAEMHDFEVLRAVIEADAE